MLKVTRSIAGMKPSGWSPLLFREEAAVIVAVHEGKYGRNTVSSEHFKRLKSRSPLLSISALGNVLKMMCSHETSGQAYGGVLSAPDFLLERFYLPSRPTRWQVEGRTKRRRSTTGKHEKMMDVAQKVAAVADATCVSIG